MKVIIGILIPFFGTSLGAAFVFFMRKSLSDMLQRALTGFAAGVMVAASIWSLLIPAIDQSSEMGEMVICTGDCRILGRNDVFADVGYCDPTSASEE